MALNIQLSSINTIICCVALLQEPRVIQGTFACLPMTPKSAYGLELQSFLYLVWIKMQICQGFIDANFKNIIQRFKDRLNWFQSF